MAAEDFSDAPDEFERRLAGLDEREGTTAARERERLHRVDEGEKRGVAGARREQAEVDRQTAEAEQRTDS